MNQGCLSASCGTDDSHRLSAVYLKIDVFQNVITGLAVRETDIFELHTALCDMSVFSGRIRIRQINFRIHYLIDSLY